MKISKEELRLIRYHGGMSGHIWEIDREIDKRKHQAEKNPSLNSSKLIEILKEEKKILLLMRISYLNLPQGRLR